MITTSFFNCLQMILILKEINIEYANYSKQEMNIEKGVLK